MVVCRSLPTPRRAEEGNRDLLGVVEWYGAGCRRRAQRVPARRRKGRTAQSRLECAVRAFVVWVGTDTRNGAEERRRALKWARGQKAQNNAERAQNRKVFAAESKNL